MQKVRRHPPPPPKGRAGLRLLLGIRFQDLFHPPRRGAFHLSLTLLVRYRSSRSTYAWRGAPPSSGGISRVPPYSRTEGRSPRTGLSPAVGGLSIPFRF